MTTLETSTEVPAQQPKSNPAKAAAKTKPTAKAATKAKPAAKAKAPTKQPAPVAPPTKSVTPPPAAAKFELTARITIVAKENPHRAGSKDFGKFKKLKAGMTVEQALAAQIDRGYLNYMVRRELIAIS